MLQGQLIIQFLLNVSEILTIRTRKISLDNFFHFELRFSESTYFQSLHINFFVAVMGSLYQKVRKQKTRILGNFQIYSFKVPIENMKNLIISFRKIMEYKF